MATHLGRSGADGGIALILFAIFVLGRPFGGDLRVGPDAFELVLTTIEVNDAR